MNGKKGKEPEMSFFKRVEGVFFGPGPMFRSLAEKPVWFDALIILLLLLAVFAAVVAPYSQSDQLQMFKDNTRLKERMGETRYAEMIARIENASPSGAVAKGVVLGTAMGAIGLLFSSLVLLILGRFVSAQGNYISVVAAVVHASFIDKLLGNAVRAFLIVTRKSLMQTSTSLAMLFPKIEMTSPAYVILGQIDLFQIWMFGVLAVGLSAVFKVDLRKSLFISYGFWLLKSVIYIALGIIGMSYMK
ncbi:MAG TPA: YIP1 family protein [Acidobacteriota bacterium]|nr:YIP1 family protein [Acidobacteriota bacterium]